MPTHEHTRRVSALPRGRCDLRRLLQRLPRAAILSGVLALIAPVGALAQASSVLPRVTDRVNLSQLTVLTGNTHPLARTQYDQGAAPPDLPMNRIMLVLKRSPDQEAALQDLLVQQQTTSAANYHKWLTPDQFGQQFGPADSDIQAVTSWLASFGFQSIKVSRGRTVIEFSGNASQVATALHAPIHRYLVNGVSHWANANDPQIPSALAPVIAGFDSLNNFEKKPTSVRSGQFAPFTQTPGARPQITFTDGSHGVAPADFDTIYNVGSTMTGSDVTIGVVARSNIIPQDVADFRNLFGLAGSGPNIILDGPDPGDLGGGEEAEAVLDSTWPGAVAPNATVDLVVSESTNAVSGEDLSEIYIVDNNVSDIMTESFDECEADFGSSLSGAASYYSAVAEQAAAQGITYLVSSGDGGPDACDDPSTVPSPPSPASVNILAATPFNVAVGGTQFNDIANPNTYWSQQNPANYGTAKSYIPENAWNESCTVAQCGVLSGLWSSGGGQSSIFPKPVWQAGVAGIPSGNRAVPDVALTAANHDGYVLCLDASCEGNNPGFAIISGTSASVQTFGGIMALVVQKTVARVGIANYALYKLAGAETLSSCNGSNTTTLPAGSCTFNDVTAGNTNLTIVGENGFTAGTGYDEATGLGSVNVTNLVNNWSTAIVDATTTALTLNNGTAVNVTHGTTVPVGITVAPVAPATGTPTGDVSLLGNSLNEGGVDGFTLSNGSVSSSTNSTIYLPGGTYQVKAHYEGDGTFLGSDSTPVSVTVSAEGSQTSLGIVVNTPCTISSSVVYGSPYILSVAVADLHSAPTPCIPNEFSTSPTGSISLTDTVNGVTTPLDGGSFRLNEFGYFEYQTIQLPAGVHTIKASYPGDNSFTSSSTTSAITVTQATTATSVGANPTTASAGQSVTLTATVATVSNATANSSQEPTGTVQFYLGGATFGSPVTVTGGIASSGYAQAIAVMSTTTLANGSNSITAKYLGDSNYSASAISSAVTVTVGTSGINVSPGCSSSTITISSPGASGSCLISVTGANGFSGTVALTCGVSSSPAGASDLPTCAFGAPDSSFTSPGTLTLSTTSETGTATLTVNTTAAAGVFGAPSNRRLGPNWLPIGEAGAALACLFLLGIAGQKRRGMVLLGMALCAVILVGTSCSGGNSGGGTLPTNPGTTVGSYTITVTSTPSGGAAQPTPITINVLQ